MSYELFHVDAFTEHAFAGNPAAVCFCPEARGAEWMAKVAREMNLSETAFLTPREDGFALRWFTPAIEVPLCGHATLASAHVLWETGRLAAGEVARFHTASGLLTAERRGDWIEMDFPAMPPVEVPSAPPLLLQAIGAPARFIGRKQGDYFVELESEAAVRALAPDLAQLLAVPARAAIVTARAEPGPYDFVSRFFAPGAGVNEDPVTGAAHCVLAPYWGALLGKEEMVAYQASPRGGVVRVRLVGERVKLIGQAVTVLAGRLLV
ncbi:MAG TPA: PhzF family phenazine biosynthesis protein [Thermoanaerobaculia bacterium]|nr:PhzF family phenazine biosynthesis protein [Thermoanaerobaculia bacterium]